MEQTVNQLKNGRLKDLDLENLIKELESIGRSEKRKIIGRLGILIMHLLKGKYRPEKRTSDWISTISIVVNVST
ncbi:MAG: DUF29 domain-containing protein [Microcystis sp. M049S2]|uniref:DUF29 domain-containing protein n=1 Tax=Microcystis sp. M049S2 TaxID=2771169 RepID=UPI00258C4DB8|nr:DUF29 domain-containing protein [Microcystis sp. M049S2]MCA2659019.1 DUF29 domain-containing protein [Microcystis sp. M049S2]